MDEFNFATVVTERDGELTASHLPFWLDRSEEPYGRAARARRHPESTAQRFPIRPSSAGDFSRPAYLRFAIMVCETGERAHLELHGGARLRRSRKYWIEAGMVALLKDLVGKHERPFEQPWDFDPNAAWIRKLLPEIAGFEIKIEKLQGKFKLNQNRTAADRAGVIETLSASEDPLAARGCQPDDRSADLFIYRNLIS